MEQKTIQPQTPAINVTELHCVTVYIYFFKIYISIKDKAFYSVRIVFKAEFVPPSA